MLGLLPLGAALVSAAFCISLLRQFAQRRKLHQLAWALAMAAFAVASLSASLGVVLGWTPAYFRSYYLFGAVVNVPVLALGTVYLHLPRKIGHVAAVAVVAASLLAAVQVAGADLRTPVDGIRGAIPAGSAVMPDGIRSLSRYYSYAGFLVVVGGAVWSSLRLFRRSGSRFRRLAQGNGLIALGTVIVAAGSAFARHGAGSVFATGLAAGVTVMYAGFLRTRPLASVSSAAAVIEPPDAPAAGNAAG